jgi:hypothetical protein
MQLQECIRVYYQNQLEHNTNHNTTSVTKLPRMYVVLCYVMVCYVCTLSG